MLIWGKKIVLLLTHIIWYKEISSKMGLGGGLTRPGTFLRLEPQGYNPRWAWKGGFSQERGGSKRGVRMRGGRDD